MQILVFLKSLNKLKVFNFYNKRKSDSEYVQITKTQNTFNNIAWRLLTLSSMVGIFKGLSSMKKIPKLVVERK